jgi:hypothetical protein
VAGAAIGPYEKLHNLMVIECDVAIIGGGLGGVAAALRACRSGVRVCLTEESAWLGGQATSQGVSALDEHDHIETFGATASYYELREAIRDQYRLRYQLSESAQQAPFFNPGDGWVSRLCFEPSVCFLAIVGLLLPEVQAGRLQILYRTRPASAELDGDTITAVTVAAADGVRTEIRASWFLDATELGDLLPLTGCAWVAGAESREQTEEPNARIDGPAPELTQTWTMPFVVDLCHGQDHTIQRPPNYERMRDEQPFTLTMRYGSRELTYKVFEPVPDLPGAFWTYRRILSAACFEPKEVPGDLAMINWAGNDFKGGDLVSAEPDERRQLIDQARQLSLAFLYWLQTEVPRDDGSGYGYPELRLRTDVLGTEDGLSMMPYIRESRRIIARTTVREQDVSAAYQPGTRAADFPDSVGVGWYPIDIHGMPADVAATGPTRPFQIPLGALIPRHGPQNLLAACKNVGTTHMTNGCYRLHPVEWNIGEAAGALAAFCLGEGCGAVAVHEQPERLRRFQASLVEVGVPLYWFTDVPIDHVAFAATQKLAVAGTWQGSSDDLLFRPGDVLEGVERERLAATSARDVPLTDAVSRGDAAIVLV